MIEYATNVFVNRDQPRVVILRNAFQGSACKMRKGGSKFVFRVDKASWLAGIALQVFVERGWLRYRNAVVEVKMAARAEKRFMWCDEPDQNAKRLVTAVFVDPGDRTVSHQIVGIDVLISLLRAHLAFPAFFEQWIDVVVTWVVVAKVI